MKTLFKISQNMKIPQKNENIELHTWLKKNYCLMSTLHFACSSSVADKSISFVCVQLVRIVFFSSFLSFFLSIVFFLSFFLSSFLFFFLSFFVSCVAKTQLNHWTKQVVRTRFIKKMNERKKERKILSFVHRRVQILSRYGTRFIA